MKTRGTTTRSAKNATTASTTATATTIHDNKFSSPSVAVKPNAHIADASERLADAAASPTPTHMIGRQVRFATSLVATPVLVSTRQNSAQVSSYQPTETLDNIIGRMQGLVIQDRQDEEQEREQANNKTTIADNHRATAAIAATLPTTINSSATAASALQLSPSCYVPFGKRKDTPYPSMTKHKSPDQKEENEDDETPLRRGGRRLNSPCGHATTSTSNTPVQMTAFYETVVQSKKTGGAVKVKRSARNR
jgi:hypothetical protein